MAKRTLVLLFAALIWTAGCSDDEEGSGSDGGSNNDGSGATLVTFAGEVLETGSDQEPPVAGATVTLRDSSPLVQDTTDANGMFSIQVPSDRYFVIEVEGANLLTSLFAASVSSAITDVELSLLSPAVVNQVVDALSLPDRDTSKGIVIVNFDLDDRGSNAVGSEMAEISASNGGAIVFDTSEEPLLDDTLVEDGGDVVVFIDVNPGTTQLTIGGSGCSSDLAASTSYPVEANKVTWLFATCDAI